MAAWIMTSGVGGIASYAHSPSLASQQRSLPSSFSISLVSQACEPASNDASHSLSLSLSLSLCVSASAEADLALSFDPKDAAAHILKSLALHLMGHKSSALRSLDAALSPPASKSLSDAERADALVKRAELQIEVNRRRRIDAAVSDLVEAVGLASGNLKAYCLLGSCYENKGMKEEAREAYESAVRIDAASTAARDGLKRLVSD